MNSTTNTGRALRLHGFATNDGVTIRHDSLLTLHFQSFKPLPGAGKRVAADLAKVVAVYGAPLVRIDDHSVMAIFLSERGSAASLHDDQGRTWLPSWRFTGTDTIVILRHEICGRDGIRIDGRWTDSRSPLNTPRRSIPYWPYTAETDLRQDLETALNAARERGDLRWTHEDAAPPQVHKSWVEMDRGDAPSEPTRIDRLTDGEREALRYLDQA